jgi:hypothetical protein
MLKAVDVPTVTVVAQGEVEGMAWSRKPDSDEAIGKHRRYEVAMASHIDKNAYAGMPSFAEQTAIASAQGTPDWPFNARCEPEIQFQEEPLLSYMFEMALGQLDRWSRGGGYNPPHAPLMELDAKGKLVLDEFGIGKGGIRSPYSDVPTAKYLTASGGPGNCREFGSTHPLTYKQMDQRYGSAAKYADKVDASIKDMVKGGWLLDADADRMRRLLLQ